MVDVNKDGIIDAEQELNLHQLRAPEYANYTGENTQVPLPYK
jgi:hypothetical protein